MSKLPKRARKHKEALIVVGAGMAAVRFVEELTAASPGRFAIRVIGEEAGLAYNRVLLSSVLASDVAIEDIELKPAQWWRDAGVEVLSGCKVSKIDANRQCILLESGKHVHYSRLVLATGSRALRLPIEGSNLPGVYTFRDVSDVEALAKVGSARKKVLVIGGGLLGLEAAYGLAKRGAEVTLVHVMDRLMERQLDATGGALLARLVSTKGVRVQLNVHATRIRGRERVEGVEFADGSKIDVDAVVFAVGARPNIDLAREGGLAVKRGIVVDDLLATSAGNVFAIGECVEHRGVCYGLVDPAYEQARVLAAHLSGHNARYKGSVVATNLKVSGVRVFSAGDFLGGETAHKIVCSDPRMGIYKKLVVQDDKLCGAILIGDVRDALAYLELIRSGASVAVIRDELIFGVPPSLQKAA
jgi:nitrite reductase (NADH) large subunit